MGKNPGIIKTIIKHTPQGKHAVFKDEIPAALKAVTLHVFEDGKETLKSKATAIKDLLSSSLAERKKCTNSFYFFPVRSWGWEKFEI